MIRREDLRVGDALRSLNLDDKYQDVEVVELDDDRMRVLRANGRRTFVKLPTERYEHANAAA